MILKMAVRNFTPKGCYEIEDIAGVLK